MIFFSAAISPVIQALMATLLTWFVTALGALTVFFIRKPNRAVLDSMLGFAGGVMLAASCWSLLIPAIEQAQNTDMSVLLHVAAGMAAGGVFMLAGDRVCERLRRSAAADRCSSMLMFAITLHNIPEGLCVGVAFGAASKGLHGADLPAACMLALGIAIQNFPEGAAVSLPCLRSGMSRRRAFFMGQFSGAVEPLAGIAGAMAAMHVNRLLPFLLSFAAGAMVYAVAGEIFPESKRKSGFPAFCAIIGFVVMMSLDVLLG